MAANTTTTQHGKARTIRKTFSRETTVSIDIKADPLVIWALLTNASDYPRWNPTIISITGNIAAGETIKLVSALDAKRTFKLNHLMRRTNWFGAMPWGERVFTLENSANGMVLFTMSEKIGGPIFPLFVKMIPPFDASFEQFAASLKKEAENIMHTK